MEKLTLIECPRDAMQGIHDFIPTDLKINYINSLLECGFDTIDFGSFVSPKAIPQLRDTAKVLAQLALSTTKTKLLAIVANERGANDAINFEEIDYLGFPFSISETFQQRNTNSSIHESFELLDKINSLCFNNNKQLVVYLSMAFGNPYGDLWSPEIAVSWCEKLVNEFNIKVIAVSDTVGTSTPESIKNLFETLIPSLPNTEFGAHLHTRYENALNITKAAYEAGVRRFDSAIKGYGGCPMATDDLTGNLPTEAMLAWFNSQTIETNIDLSRFENSMEISNSIFL